MQYLDMLKGKHIEDLKNLLQDSLNLPSVNKQFVGAIENELSNRGIQFVVETIDNDKKLIVHLTEVGCN